MTQNQSPDARHTADQVLQRDRRRIRNLAIVTIALWIMAALVIPALYLPMAAAVQKGWNELTVRVPDAAPLTAPQVADIVALMMARSVKAGGMMIAIMLLTEILA